MEREALDAKLNELRRLRDELRLKAHLLRAEAKDEWEAAEAKWRQLQAEQPALREAAGASLDEIAGSVRRLARDIAEAYARIRGAE